MSGASKSVSIKFISRVGTYMAMIQSPNGDLYQEYQRNGDKVTVMPDFSKTKPLLNFVCTSSRVAEGVSTPVSMRYYFNGVEITFDSAGSPADSSQASSRESCRQPHSSITVSASSATSSKPLAMPPSSSRWWARSQPRRRAQRSQTTSRQTTPSQSVHTRARHTVSP